MGIGYMALKTGSHPKPEVLMSAGLTHREKRVLEALRAAWDLWRPLPDKHPSDDSEFVAAIHALQNLVAFRVARRVDPEEWWQPPEKNQPA